MSPLSSLENVMFLLGVDIRSNQKRGSKRNLSIANVYLKILTLWWIVWICLESAIFITYDVYQKQSTKAMLGRKLRILNISITWFVLVRKRKVISRLITVVCNLGRCFNVAAPKLLAKISVVTILVATGSYYASLIILMDQMWCKQRVRYYSLNLLDLPDGYYCIAMHIINVLIDILQNTLPTALSALYVVLCLWVRKMLKRQATDFLNVIHSGTESTLKHHCKRYDSLFRVLQGLEDSMRFLICLEQTSNFMGIFTGILRFSQKKQSAISRKYRLASSVVFARSVVSFLCVSMAAAEVNEADAEVKSALETVLKHLVMETKHREPKDHLLPIFVFSKTTPFVLTGWSFFRFTRGFVISAVGSILTYALLITQLEF